MKLQKSDKLKQLSDVVNMMLKSSRGLKACVSVTHVLFLFMYYYCFFFVLFVFLLFKEYLKEL